jgi:hypothetical protein
MDPTQDGSGSSWQTLASVLAGGLSGYVDAQNQQPVYVAQPNPQTAYGNQGAGQVTPSATAQAPGWLWIAGLAVVAFLVLRK